MLKRVGPAVGRHPDSALLAGGILRFPFRLGRHVLGSPAFDDTVQVLDDFIQHISLVGQFVRRRGIVLNRGRTGLGILVNQGQGIGDLRNTAGLFVRSHGNLCDLFVHSLGMLENLKQ